MAHLTTYAPSGEQGIVYIAGQPHTIEQARDHVKRVRDSIKHAEQIEAEQAPVGTVVLGVMGRIIVKTSDGWYNVTPLTKSNQPVRMEEQRDTYWLKQTVKYKPEQ